MGLFLRIKWVWLLVVFSLTYGQLVAQVNANDNNSPYNATNDILENMSYHDLATTLTYQMLIGLKYGLEGFNKETLPHEAKQLRRQIGTVRIYVDIFSYAFEYNKDFDVWEELRDDLDKGYGKMGAFKDLFDTQRVEPQDAVYDKEEVKQYRKKVLKWKKKFLKPMRFTLYEYLIKYTATGVIYSRPKDSLSKFFWGSVDIAPTTEITGIQNIALLVKKLISISEEDYVVVRTVDDLTDSQNEEVFHDFRKRLRSILKVIGYFNQVLTVSQDEYNEILEIVGDLVTYYGDINDILTSYHLAIKREHNRRAREFKREIKEEFKKVQKWQEENKINEKLVLLNAMIID